MGDVEMTKEIPADVMQLALTNPPKLGELVVKLYQAINGDIWAIEWDNPATRILGGTKIPRYYTLEEALAPRENPAHPMFRHHNCWACKSGEIPCKKGNPSLCDYPTARND